MCEARESKMAGSKGRGDEHMALTKGGDDMGRGRARLTEVDLTY